MSKAASTKPPEETGEKAENAAPQQPVALTVSLPELLEDGSDLAFRQTIFGMVLALSRLQACRDAFGRAMGLTGSQFAVLVGVGHCQGREGISIRALAEHVHMAPPHVTTEVGRLLRRRLLLKRSNPLDRRGVLVSLTTRGERAVADVTPFMREINDQLFAGFSRGEMQALDRFMRRFGENGERALAVIRAAETASRPEKPAPRRRRPSSSEAEEA
ncbi:MarR family winged helix-turn-helix transcriptional regulator [Roseomonas xinghualingensis]|uniref:MarR family winged helix-turn-helix transcriptional regulator n=1 Tax=Roseomonas xinghualingensis TaxID=2986475 RepID=UPI0021F246BA|nr:MarR family winged helix-turn-helix transcriptional regulator [Roseomonas sp. SXEYE001]MCV4208959.1 MarR family winged helix-turn-helix transcriptional regulator [Roseomonas sp. SXEYE001]